MKSSIIFLTLAVIANFPPISVHPIHNENDIEDMAIRKAMNFKVEEEYNGNALMIMDKRQATTGGTGGTNPPFFRPGLGPGGPVGGGFFPDLGNIDFGSILMYIPTLAYVVFNIFFSPSFPSFIKPDQQ